MQERACGDAHYTHSGFSHNVTEIPPCPETPTTPPPSCLPGLVGGHAHGSSFPNGECHSHPSVQERACGDAHYTHSGFSHNVTEIPPCPETPTLPPVEITRFEGATREGEGAMGDFFKVSPSSAECSVRGAIQGPPPLLLGRLASVVLMYNSGSWRKVSVTTNFAGSVTVELTCTETGYVADVQSREFIAKPLVVITGFDGDTGAGTMTDSFEVSPPTASCLPYRDSGVSASMSLTGSGRSRSVSVTADTAGRVTVVLRCTKTGYVTASVPAVFIAQSRVVISEVVGGTRSGDTMTGSFRVWPSTAACSAPRPTGVTTPVSFPDDSGSSRTVSVTTTAPGPVTVALRCTKTGYVTDTASMAFTAPPAPPEVCENPLTLESDPIRVSLRASTTNPCLSNQRGDAQDPHYAKRYHFTLNTNPTVDTSYEVVASVVPSDTTDPGLVLYLTSTAGVLQTVTSEPYRFSAELVAGSYTIEITTFDPGQTGNFELSVSAVGLPTGLIAPTADIPANQSPYHVTAGVINGIVEAANSVLNLPRYTTTDSTKPANLDFNCTTNIPEEYRLTRNRLAALLLSISLNELLGDGPHAPMNVSRSDFRGVRDGNDRLYSLNLPLNMEYERAFWHPGVGLWQLDDINNYGSKLNHAQRAHAVTGAKNAAMIFLDGYCRRPMLTTGDASIARFKAALGPWHGCTKNNGQWCFDDFESMVKGSAFPVPTGPSPDVSLYLDVHTEFTDPHGGVKSLTCRWGTAGDLFKCFLYDIENNAQGEWWDGHLDGHSTKSPVADAFLSFTQPIPSPEGSAESEGSTEYKFVVFKSEHTGYDETVDGVTSDLDLIAAVPTGVNVRTSPAHRDFRDRDYFSNSNSSYEWWHTNTVNGVSVYIVEAE